MITYDIFEPDSDYNKALDNLSEQVGSLYAESWAKDKQETYGKPFNMNIAAFAQMWFNHSLKLLVAKDGDSVVGFLVGMVFRPLPYDAMVFQVEDWYSSVPEAEKGLFEYMEKAIRFIGCDEIWIADKADRDVPVGSDTWKEANRFLFRRYTRR